LFFGSGGFPEHHKPEDKIDLIDFEHLYKSKVLLYSLIKEIGDN
jgi:aminopeptidase-like protein